MPQTARLLATFGPLPRREIPLAAESLVFGRDQSADIVLDDPRVSRKHARILLRDNQHFVEDLGSTNGTFVNGDRLGTEAAPLADGAQIDFGESQTFTYQAAVTATPYWEYDADGRVAFPLPADPPAGALPLLPRAVVRRTLVDRFTVDQIKGFYSLVDATPAYNARKSALARDLIAAAETDEDGGLGILATALEQAQEALPPPRRWVTTALAPLPPALTVPDDQLLPLLQQSFDAEMLLDLAFDLNNANAAQAAGEKAPDIAAKLFDEIAYDGSLADLQTLAFSLNPNAWPDIGSATVIMPPVSADTPQQVSGYASAGAPQQDARGPADDQEGLGPQTYTENLPAPEATPPGRSETLTLLVEEESKRSAGFEIALDYNDEIARGPNRLDLRALQAAGGGDPHSYGMLLAEGVLADEALQALAWRALYDPGQARQQRDWLHVALAVDDAFSELYWEYLLVPGTEPALPLAAQPGISFVRAGTTLPGRDPAPARPLRVLLAGVDQAVLDKLRDFVTPALPPLYPLEAALPMLQNVLAPLEQAGAAVVDTVDNLTAAILTERLRGGGYHVIHLLTHVVAYETGTRLVLADGEGGPQLVNADSFQWEDARETLRLVTIAGAPSREQNNSPAQVARRLLERGVAACLAFQEPLTDRERQAFYTTFYEELLRSGHGAVAASAGRRALLDLNPDGWAWGGPALFVRGSDALLFDPQAAAPAVDVAQAPAEYAVAVPVEGVADAAGEPRLEILSSDLPAVLPWDSRPRVRITLRNSGDGALMPEQAIHVDAVFGDQPGGGGVIAGETVTAPQTVAPGDAFAVTVNFSYVNPAPGQDGYLTLLAWFPDQQSEADAVQLARQVTIAEGYAFTVSPRSADREVTAITPGQPVTLALALDHNGQYPWQAGDRYSYALQWHDVDDEPVELLDVDATVTISGDDYGVPESLVVQDVPTPPLAVPGYALRGTLRYEGVWGVVEAPVEFEPAVAEQEPESEPLRVDFVDVSHPDAVPAGFVPEALVILANKGNVPWPAGTEWRVRAGTPGVEPNSGADLTGLDRQVMIDVAVAPGETQALPPLALEEMVSETTGPVVMTLQWSVEQVADPERTRVTGPTTTIEFREPYRLSITGIDLPETAEPGAPLSTALQLEHAGGFTVWRQSDRLAVSAAWQTPDGTPLTPPLDESAVLDEDADEPAPSFPLRGLTAPAEPGDYLLQVALTHSGPFGDTTAAFTTSTPLTVVQPAVAPTHDFTVEKVDFPGTLRPGAAAVPTFHLRNSGDASWAPSDVITVTPEAGEPVDITVNLGVPPGTTVPLTHASLEWPIAQDQPAGPLTLTWELSSSDWNVTRQAGHTLTVAERLPDYAGALAVDLDLPAADAWALRRLHTPVTVTNAGAQPWADGAAQLYFRQLRPDGTLVDEKTRPLSALAPGAVSTVALQVDLADPGETTLVWQLLVRSGGDPQLLAEQSSDLLLLVAPEALPLSRLLDGRRFLADLPAGLQARRLTALGRRLAEDSLTPTERHDHVADELLPGLLDASAVVRSAALEALAALRETDSALDDLLAAALADAGDSTGFKQTLRAAPPATVAWVEPLLPDDFFHEDEERPVTLIQLPPALQAPPAAQTLRIELLESEARAVYGDVEGRSPLDPSRLDALADARAGTPAAYGRLLFETVFSALQLPAADYRATYDVYTIARAAAANRLRVELRAADALGGHFWETMRAATEAMPLATFEGAPFYRRFGSNPVEPVDAAPLRILFAISNPRTLGDPAARGPIAGLAPLNVAQERAIIEKDIGPLRDKELIVFELLDGSSGPVTWTPCARASLSSTPTSCTSLPTALWIPIGVPCSFCKTKTAITPLSAPRNSTARC